MPDLDRASLKILRDLVEILGKLRQRSPDLVIGVVRKPSRSIGLRPVVACAVHNDINMARTPASRSLNPLMFSPLAIHPIAERPTGSFEPEFSRHGEPLWAPKKPELQSIGSRRRSRAAMSGATGDPILLKGRSLSASPTAVERIRSITCARVRGRKQVNPVQQVRLPKNLDQS